MKLLEEACNNVTAVDWKNVAEKTKNLVLHDWERDVNIDKFIDSQLIINVNDESSDSSENESIVEMEEE